MVATPTTPINPEKEILQVLNEEGKYKFLKSKPDEDPFQQVEAKRPSAPLRLNHLKSQEGSLANESPAPATEETTSQVPEPATEEATSQVPKPAMETQLEEAPKPNPEAEAEAEVKELPMVTREAQQAAKNAKDKVDKMDAAEAAPKVPKETAKAPPKRAKAAAKKAAAKKAAAQKPPPKNASAKKVAAKAKALMKRPSARAEPVEVEAEEEPVDGGEISDDDDEDKCKKNLAETFEAAVDEPEPSKKRPGRAAKTEEEEPNKEEDVPKKKKRRGKKEQVQETSCLPEQATETKDKEMEKDAAADDGSGAQGTRKLTFAGRYPPKRAAEMQRFNVIRKVFEENIEPKLVGSVTSLEAGNLLKKRFSN